MRTPTRIATTIAATTLLLATGTAAAVAQSTTLDDHHSDVLHYVGEDDQSPDVLGHTASIRSGVDARQFRINHGTSFVSLRYSVVHLKADHLEADVTLQRNGGKHSTDWMAIVRFTAASGTWRAVVFRPGDDVPLCTVRATVDASRLGSIYAQVPRSCLGNPTTLRARASLGRHLPATDTRPEEGWGDVVTPTRSTVNAAWTSWVRRD